jgi:multiple sugar transport system substrate-binding protein
MEDRLRSKRWQFILLTILALTSIVLSSCAPATAVPAAPQPAAPAAPAAAAPAAPAAPAPAAAAPAAKRAEIKFWAVHTSGPETENAMRKLVEQFNKEHPDIFVTMETVSGNVVYPKFLTAVQGGDMPDIADTYAFQPLQFAAMDQMLPLDDIYAEWKANGTLDKMTNPSAYQHFNWNGHIWAVPWEIDLRAIYYRKDLLAAAGIQPPTDWDSFQKAVVALNKPDQGIFGLTFPAGNFHIAQHYYMMFMLQAGGSLLDKDGNLAFGTTSKAANLQALQYMTDFATKYKAIPPGAASYNTDEAETIFIQGKAAFAMGTGQIVTKLMTQNPDLMKNVGVLETLQGPKAKQTVAFYAPISIWKYTKYPEASKTFLKWLVQPGRLEPLYAARPGQMFPVFKPDFDMKVFKDIPLMGELNAKSVAYAVDFTNPSTIGVPPMGAIDGEKMFAQPVNEVVAGTKTPEQAINDAHANMAKLWALPENQPKK